MIGYKDGLRSLLHFPLQPNSWYTIKVVEEKYGTPVIYSVTTDNHGEIVLPEMTNLIPIHRTETHGGERERNSKGGKDT